MSKELKDQALNSIKFLNKKTQRPDEENCEKSKDNNNNLDTEIVDENKKPQIDVLIEKENIPLVENLLQSSNNHIPINSQPQNENKVNESSTINKEELNNNIDNDNKINSTSINEPKEQLATKDKELSKNINQINTQLIADQTKIIQETPINNQKIHQPSIPLNNEVDNKIEQNNTKTIKEKGTLSEIKEIPKTILKIINPIIPESKKEEEKDTKKITFSQAKNEITEFKQKIDQIELELYNRYGIKLSEFNYDEIFPEEFSMKIIEEYFKEKKA